jgi:hypothetical protein
MTSILMRNAGRFALPVARYTIGIDQPTPEPELVLGSVAVSAKKEASPWRFAARERPL